MPAWRPSTTTSPHWNGSPPIWGSLDRLGAQEVCLHPPVLEDREPDGDVLADCRERRARMKELVIAERRRPGVGPAQSIKQRTHAVQRATYGQQHRRGHPGVV